VTIISHRSMMSCHKLVTVSQSHSHVIVKTIDGGLYFIASVHFYFILLFISFSFHFYFLFLEQLGLGFISHAVTLVTN